MFSFSFIRTSSRSRSSSSSSSSLLCKSTVYLPNSSLWIYYAETVFSPEKAHVPFVLKNSQKTNMNRTRVPKSNQRDHVRLVSPLTNFVESVFVDLKVLCCQKSIISPRSISEFFPRHRLFREAWRHLMRHARTHTHTFRAGYYARTRRCWNRVMFSPPLSRQCCIISLTIHFRLCCFCRHCFVYSKPYIKTSYMF